MRKQFVLFCLNSTNSCLDAGVVVWVWSDAVVIKHYYISVNIPPFPYPTIASA